MTNTGDVPVGHKVIEVVDEVTGPATYDTDTQALTVNAVSSDTAGAETLTATGYGPSLRAPSRFRPSTHHRRR